MRHLSLISFVMPVLALAACQEQCARDRAGCNELANKHEYSVLQAMEYRLRDRHHNQSYLLFPNALESDLTVVAFPRADANVGYVVLLTNAKVPPRDKAMPDVDFLVTSENLDDLKADTTLSAEVERYIRDMVRKHST
jgi:hypothetical protein